MDQVLRILAIDGTLLHEVRHGDGVCSVDFHPSGAYIATGCSNGKLSIINADKGKIEREVDHGAWVRDCRFGGDGQHIATVGSKLRILDLLSDCSFELAPWRWYEKVLDKPREAVSKLCTSSPSFPHRRAPDFLLNLTTFHLAALFGKIDHGQSNLQISIEIAPRATCLDNTMGPHSGSAVL